MSRAQDKRPCRRNPLPTAVLSLVFGCLDPTEVFCRCYLVCSSWRAGAAWSLLDARALSLMRCSLEFRRLFSACVPIQVRRMVVDAYYPEMLTAFANLEHCELRFVNLENYLRPLAFARRLQSLTLYSCIFWKSRTPLAGLGTNLLRVSSFSYFDADDCDLSVNDGILELEYVGLTDSEARQISTIHSVTSLRILGANLSAHGFSLLFNLPLLRRLCLMSPKLNAPTFETIPPNAVEVLELISLTGSDFYADEVVSWSAGFRNSSVWVCVCTPAGKSLPSFWKRGFCF
jgi:hypothetical protein